MRNAMCRAPDFRLKGNAHTRSADGQSNEHVRQKVRADATSHRVALLDQLPSWHDNDLEIPLPTELQEAAVRWLFRFVRRWRCGDAATLLAPRGHETTCVRRSWNGLGWVATGC